MKENKIINITVIIPVHNGATTLLKTLNSLVEQSQKIDELIIINDNSTDESLDIIKEFFCNKNFSFYYKLINHDKSYGLARSYNEGINESKSDLIITLHQDVLILEGSLKKLVKPFLNNEENVVAATHIVMHPYEIWNNYNFWEKVFFARLVGKDYSGIDGKFDCFKRLALKKINGFDEINYKTAGEDGDVVFKLKTIGKIVNTEARIIHIHRMDDFFSYKDVIKKQKQYSEAQGVNFRRGRFDGAPSFVRAFFRELLLLSLFLPFVNIIGFILIIFYSILYTKEVYLKEFRNYRTLLLPFFNIYLLFISFIYSIRGFINGKQKI